MRPAMQCVRDAWSRLTVVAVLALVVTATPAAAAPRSDVVVLPGATAAEGIAGGPGSTFFAGDLFTGDIFRGDLQHGTAELFIDAPDTRQAAGMKFDPASGLLFVAGLFTGQGYVYDTATGSTVALYQFADPADGPVINDVTITREGAWFTDSTHPTLYFVPLAGACPDRSAHSRSAAPPPRSTGSSASTASPPPPTAPRSWSRTRATPASTPSIPRPEPARSSKG